jgi:hypothetical protein
MFIPRPVGGDARRFRRASYVVELAKELPIVMLHHGEDSAVKRLHVRK